MCKRAIYIISMSITFRGSGASGDEHTRRRHIYEESEKSSKIQSTVSLVSTIITLTYLFISLLTFVFSVFV